MQDSIIQLKALGQMPDSLSSNPPEELVSKYDDLLAKVKTPLTEGVIVIRYYLALRGAENGVTAMVTPFFCVQG